MNRIDGYIQSTNKKAGVIATFNTLILGAVAKVLTDVSQHAGSISEWSGTSPALLLAPALLSGLSLLFVIFSVIPYLESGTKTEKHKSNIFFGDISSQEVDRYVSRVKNLKDEETLIDLSRQVYVLSQGAHQKFKCLRTSFWFLIFAGLSILSLYPFYL